MAKVNVTVEFPIKTGTLGLYKTELTKKIRVNQLVSYMRKRIDLAHLDEIYVLIERDNSNIQVFHEEKSNMPLFLKENDTVHLLCYNCMAATSPDKGEVVHISKDGAKTSFKF